MTQTIERRERPILFSATMVRAILDGRKTQTRRILKKQPDLHANLRPEKRNGASWVFMAHTDFPEYQFACGDVRCPYGEPGDKLWVRETWAARLDEDHLSPAQLKGRTIGYWADGPGKCCRTGCNGAAGRKRPSIHMPRWASRILLEIEDVCIERIQDISDNDAEAEGVAIERSGNGEPTPRSHGPAFVRLWRSINGDSAWFDNPWVWVIKFKRLKP